MGSVFWLAVGEASHWNRATQAGIHYIRVVPWDGTEVIDHRSGDAPEGFARWWEAADRLWQENAREGRSPQTTELIGNVDYMSKLSSQFPASNRRVVYTKAGNTLNAAIVSDERAVIDHKLYWAHAHSEEEAMFLCGIFNTASFRDEIVGYQPVGLFGPRDFDKYLFEVPWDRYSPSDPLHVSIAGAAAEAAEIARAADLSEMGSFTAARSHVRTLLEAEGVAQRLDELIVNLLTRP